MSIKRFGDFDKSPVRSIKEGKSQVEDFKQTVTKVFMEYDKSKFSDAERKEIIDWLTDKSTSEFFSGLLKEDTSAVNESAVRISLSEDNFRTLVTGGIVEEDNCKIILQDIGLDNMIRIIKESK